MEESHVSALSTKLFAASVSRDLTTEDAAEKIMAWANVKFPWEAAAPLAEYLTKTRPWKLSYIAKLSVIDLAAMIGEGKAVTGQPNRLKVDQVAATIRLDNTVYKVDSSTADAFQKMKDAKGQPVGISNETRKPKNWLKALSANMPDLAAIVEKGRGTSGFRLTIFDRG